MKNKMQADLQRLESTVSRKVDELYKAHHLAEIVKQIKRFLLKYPDYSYHLNLTGFVRNSRTHKPIRHGILRNLMGQIQIDHHKEHARAAHVVLGVFDPVKEVPQKFCLHCGGTGFRKESSKGKNVAPKRSTV